MAAECDYEGRPAIVLCCDWRAQTGTEGGPLIGTDDAYKLRQRGAATILIAGHPTSADELLTICRPAIDEFTKAPVTRDFDLVIDKFLTSLRKAAARKKRDLADHFIEMNFGMTFDELKTRPYDDFVEIWSKVATLTLRADLIIGYVADEAIVITLDRWGQTQWHQNYAIAGEGSDVARAMLSLQPWEGYGSFDISGPFTSVPLPRCLYRLYEAKRAAHIANPSSVGEATQFEILLAGGKRHGIDSAAFERLENAFKEKHRVPDVEIDKSSLIEAQLHVLR